MKKIIYLFTIIGLLVACNSDDNSGTNDEVTTAKIRVVDIDGTTVENMTVYAYMQDTWLTFNEPTPFLSDFQSVTNAQGVANFNVSGETFFTSINNYTNTVRFTVFYTRNGVDYTITKGETFSKGDDKNIELNLQ